jgi:hypothetical protein
VLEEDRRATRAAGMDGFAVKPVELPRLLAEIARVTGLGTAMPAGAGGAVSAGQRPPRANGHRLGARQRWLGRCGGAAKAPAAHVLDALRDCLQRGGGLGHPRPRRRARWRTACRARPATWPCRACRPWPPNWNAPCPPTRRPRPPGLDSAWQGLRRRCRRCSISWRPRLPRSRSALPPPHHRATPAGPDAADLHTLRQQLQRGELDEAALRQVCAALDADAARRWSRPPTALISTSP